MKKEDLEKRIQELSVARDQAIANANALSGAIQELQRLIKELEKDA